MNPRFPRSPRIGARRLFAPGLPLMRNEPQTELAARSVWAGGGCAPREARPSSAGAVAPGRAGGRLGPGPEGGRSEDPIQRRAREPLISSVSERGPGAATGQRRGQGGEAADPRTPEPPLRQAAARVPTALPASPLCSGPPHLPQP